MYGITNQRVLFLLAIGKGMFYATSFDNLSGASMKIIPAGYGEIYLGRKTIEAGGELIAKMEFLTDILTAFEILEIQLNPSRSDYSSKVPKQIIEQTSYQNV